MFSLLLDGARVTGNGLFLLRSVTNKEKNSRFGVSVSKKVAKSAVVRNRLRRAGYRCLKDYLPKIKENFLVSISFRKIPKDNLDLRKNLESLLKTSQIFK
jgi:ribonuclease P protein component